MRRVQGRTVIFYLRRLTRLVVFFEDECVADFQDNRLFRRW
jgi:hypothetical protein